MLEELARKGHLEMQMEEGIVAYSLGEPDRRALPGGDFPLHAQSGANGASTRLEDPLSERELEVLSLLATGKTNSEVAGIYSSPWAPSRATRQHLPQARRQKPRRSPRQGARARPDLTADCRGIGASSKSSLRSQPSAFCSWLSAESLHTGSFPLQTAALRRRSPSRAKTRTATMRLSHFGPRMNPDEPPRSTFRMMPLRPVCP